MISKAGRQYNENTQSYETAKTLSVTPNPGEEPFLNIEKV